ncbi:MAG: hypothetical protein HYY24_23935 [Verrucomicrobia bacterium]|nr:hypothetical protein [Verrucomicrobiota bacterium]
MSTRELIDREVASLPEPLQHEVYDFVRFPRRKTEGERFNLEKAVGTTKYAKYTK